MYRFLQDRKDRLLADSGPLKSIARCTTRFIFRSTYVYAGIFDEALSPESLRSGIDFSLTLERLARPFLSGRSKPSLWALFPAETEALAEGDVPRFLTPVNATGLPLAQGDAPQIKRCFQESGLERCRRIISGLSEDDRCFQARILRGCLAAHGMTMLQQKRKAERRRPPITATGPSAQEIASLDDVRPLSPDELVAEACRIARELDACKVAGRDGSINWLGFRPVGANGHRRFSPLGHDLYGGRTGVALFFAALDAVQAYPGAADRANGALQELRTWLRTRPRTHGTDGQTVAPHVQLQGGMTGLGSALYALTRVAALTEDVSLLEDARIAARLIAAGQPDSTPEWGVVSGAAGTILTLLMFYEALPEEWIVDAAIRLGDALIDAKRCVNGSPPAWPQPGGKTPLTGFSHGAAGIAYALTRLYKSSGEARFLRAAQDGFAYERAVFDSAMGNWPDLREAGTALGRGASHEASSHGAAQMVSWCHGAAGIALSRLALLECATGDEAAIWEKEAMQKEIQVGLATTLKHEHRWPDSLCCGEMGRAEILWEAGRRLDSPWFRQAASERTARLVRRAQNTGRYALFHPEMTVKDAPGWFLPGFMSGLSGIGYALLRQAYPEKLPSVLLLES